MLYLIGLGLNERGISKEGLLAIDKCAKVYLEGYTVDFPYDVEELKFGNKKIEVLERGEVESNDLIKEAKGRKIALLVYGSPLFATTHMSLIQDAHSQKVRTKIIYSASVFDGIAETGLQLYKFGKISSMPKWSGDYEPDFLQYVEENKTIKAHSLILVDIGLGFKKALVQLEMCAQKKQMKLDKILVCSKIGNEDNQIFYAMPDILRTKDVEAPFCFIIPGDMHFLEKEVVEGFG
jgi:diphthine synthase